MPALPSNIIARDEFGLIDLVNYKVQAPASLTNTLN